MGSLLAVPAEEVAAVTDHADQIRGEILQTGYACNADGFDRHNRGNWCDLGCGRDYNRMIPVTVIKTTALDSLLARLREAEQRAETLHRSGASLVNATGTLLDLPERSDVQTQARRAMERVAAALSQPTPEGER